MATRQKTEKAVSAISSLIKDAEFTFYLTNSKKSKLLANFSVNLGGLILKNFKIVEGKNGEFVSFPSTEGNGEYYDTLYFLNVADREEFSELALQDFFEFYENEVDRGSKRNAKSR